MTLTFPATVLQAPARPVCACVLAFALAASCAAQAFAPDSAGGADKGTNPKLPSRVEGKVIEHPPSISLAPAVVMVKAKPGQTFSQNLTLWNDTTLELAFTLEASDVVIRDGKRVFVPAGETEGSIARNAVFSYPSVVVPPGSSATTTVTVTIPPNPGPRAIACIFMGKTVLRTKNAMAMTGSLGTLITFTLDGDFRIEPRPLQVVVDSDAQSISFRQTLRNAGSDPVVPTGVIAVTDASGALVTRLQISSQRMLPGEILDFTAEHAGLFKPGKYRAMLLMENETAFISNAAEFAVK